jgi:hypothetical protein
MVGARAVKYGVLTFSYRHFAHFETQLEAAGAYTVNLGDNMQSLATRGLYRELGIPDSAMIDIDRDSLATYDGPPVKLLMNGVFAAHCFPLPPQVHPIFVGFHAKLETLLPRLEELRRHQPIGCRDPHTQAILAANGIAAEVTGCVTLTLPRRPAGFKGRKVFAVVGDGAGKLPASLFACMPRDLLARTELVFQRMPVFESPISSATMRHAERYAAHLLETYRREAALVVTPLHHAASPCMAAGIPVILARKNADVRFGHLATILRLHEPADFPTIDWQPTPPALDAVRSHIVQAVRSRLFGD